MQNHQLKNVEFEQFRTWLHRSSGISLAPSKQALVFSRLSKRLRQRELNSFGDYFRLIMQATETLELQTALDLLTTNETSFFREPKHFDFLRTQVLPNVQPGRTFRLWSAASSSGEEPYSLAMTLADGLASTPWEIVASDISSRVLGKARHGHYPMERASHIAKQQLSKHCLKGAGSQEGSFLIERKLRDRVQFMQINLNNAFPKIGEFDVIFLRNVMIYFDMDTKRQVVARMLPLLRPGGYFFVGHSESLNGITDALTLITPSTYRKP